eukprot:5820073-Prorocentrum_lima.AAC.1
MVHENDPDYHAVDEVRELLLPDLPSALVMEKVLEGKLSNCVRCNFWAREKACIDKIMYTMGSHRYEA